MIRQNIFEQFEKEIRKVSVKDEVNEKFNEITETLYNDFTRQFTKNSADLIVEGSGWAS